LHFLFHIVAARREKKRLNMETLKNILNFMLGITTFILKNWVWLLGLLVILVIAYSISSFQQCNFQKKSDNLKGNISTANGQIEILTEQKNALANAVNQALVNSGAAINKAENIRNANFANTKLSEAEKARCLAYPESCK
jgi:hypothetical protein